MWVIVVCVILIHLVLQIPISAQSFKSRIFGSAHTPAVQEHHDIQHDVALEETKVQRISHTPHPNQDTGEKLSARPEDHGHAAHDPRYGGKTTKNNPSVIATTTPSNTSPRIRSIPKEESFRLTEKAFNAGDDHTRESISLAHAIDNDGANMKRNPAISNFSPLMTAGSTGMMTRRKLVPASGSVTLSTDKTTYGPGELIEVTYTISPQGGYLESGSAWVAVYFEGDIRLFGTRYGSIAIKNASWPATQDGHSLTIPFSSMDLYYDTKYIAVMGMWNSDPPLILGVSNAFQRDICQDYAILTTDRDNYIEGQLIHVTCEMAPAVDNLECGFAWLAIFADNDPYFQGTPMAIQKDICPHENGNTFIITLPLMSVYGGSSDTRPFGDIYISSCKIVLGYTNSIAILGFSSSFSVRGAGAELVTDARHYDKGELINVTYTLYDEVSNMEVGFAWIALFHRNENWYDHYRAVTPRILTVSSGYSDTISFSSDQLAHGSYKAAMVLTNRTGGDLNVGLTSYFEVFDPAFPVTTQSPTQQPTTHAPTFQPISVAPTQQPISAAPTQQPISAAPTQQPISAAPTQQPTIIVLTQNPTTKGPSSSSPTLDLVLAPQPTMRGMARKPTKRAMRNRVGMAP